MSRFIGRLAIANALVTMLNKEAGVDAVEDAVLQPLAGPAVLKVKVYGDWYEILVQNDYSKRGS